MGRLRSDVVSLAGEQLDFADYDAIAMVLDVCGSWLPPGIRKTETIAAAVRGRFWVGLNGEPLGPTLFSMARLL